MSDKGSVLVTGGAGFVGSHTTVELIQAGYSVVVIDSLINSRKESIARAEEITGTKIPAYYFDILEKEKLQQVFEKHRINSVIHFASLKAVGVSVHTPLIYYKNNLGITINLLEVMRENGVKKFIFSSSATVYGDPHYLPFDEKHPVGNCTNPYGKSKFFNEEILRDFSLANPDWKFILLRYFNPVGAHKSGRLGEDPMGIPNNLTPYIAQVAVGRLPYVRVLGNDYDTRDGTGVRDYLHVVDLAVGHIAALEKVEKMNGCMAINLGTGKNHSVLEMVAAFEKACGKKIPYKLEARRDGDLPTFYANPSLAESELGWKAIRGVDDMCADMWKFQQMNPNGYAEN
ncbi:hypothetical protein ScPMuIL_010018 [Solemya velum]